MKRIVFIVVSGFFLAAFCSAQGRVGEINRGIFHQQGIASWYGGEFNGRTTASGEIFNDTQLTAAHPILPFGTMLKITNQHNNKTVTVRVNDRGPFVSERIIDLSRFAAEQLDMVRTGTAPVTVESLHEVSLASLPERPANPVLGSVTEQPANNGELSVKPGETVQVRQASVEPYSGTVTEPWAASVRFKPAIPEAANGKHYRVQVGAYKQPEYAIEAFEKLKKAGFNPVYERFGDYYRVYIGGLKHEELKTISDRLGNAGFREVLLREE